MRLDAKYIETEEYFIPGKNYREVYFYSLKEKNEYINLSLSLTFNTRKNEWLINYFFNYTWGWQTLYDLESSLHVKEFNYDEAYHSIALGIYKNIFDTGRLIGGIRFTKYTDDKGRLFIPDAFIQYDIKLF